MYKGKVLKKDRVWLSAAVKLVESMELESKGLQANRGRRRTMASSRVPEERLLRRRLSQGSPYKCPMIREMLWDWFVDVRRSLATALSPKFVLMKARQIADEVLKIMRHSGQVCNLPVLDKHWLLRWKRDKGVVFRTGPKQPIAREQRLKVLRRACCSSAGVP